MAEWGYAKHNGPATWGNNVPAANGKSQSPIDIQPANATFDQALKEKAFKISYTPANAQRLFNTGRSVQVAFDSAGSSLEGGPLAHKYQVAQFHLHWGKSNETGSEHTVDGHKYAAELHIVHYNADKYPDFGTAAASEEGLCVLGVFLKPGAEHAGLKKMTDLLPKIAHAGDSVNLEGFDPSTLLPGDLTKYWTYPGSLTTPPCYESVTWVVFKDPIEVSDEQLALFRAEKTYAKDGKPDEDELCGCMVENYRPPLALGDRKLRTSFQ